jgi:hypothetical protein
MAMFDRAWLPHLAVEHAFDGKLASDPAISQLGYAPVGYPQSIDAEMVWTGAKFQAQPGLYQIELNERHIKELEDAATEVEGNPVHLRAECSTNSG